MMVVENGNGTLDEDDPDILLQTWGFSTLSCLLEGGYCAGESTSIASPSNPTASPCRHFVTAQCQMISVLHQRLLQIHLIKSSRNMMEK